MEAELGEGKLKMSERKKMGEKKTRGKEMRRRGRPGMRLIKKGNEEKRGKETETKKKEKLIVLDICYT